MQQEQEHREQPPYQNERQREAQEEKRDVRHPLCLLARLQNLLKEEYFLLATESDQKAAFEKKIQSSLFAYYKSSVSLGDSLFRSGEGERRLMEQEGFGDAYAFVKEVVMAISKDPSLGILLIDKYQNTLPMEAMTSLARVMVSCMYENIADDDVYHKDLLKLIASCIQRILQGKKHAKEVNLQQKGFAQVVLGELTERPDARHYSRRIARNALLEIAKLDHLIDFRSQDSPLRGSVPADRKDSSHFWEGGARASSSQLTPAERRWKVRQYSEGLRAYDEKYRRQTPMKRKYRNCISEQLLSQLGIIEQIVFPCFSSGEVKAEEQGRQLGRMLHRSQAKLERHCDITAVRNIILIFFNDVFKALYSMPPLVRISARILFASLLDKFSVQESNTVVCDFLLCFWLASAVRLEGGAMAEASRVSPHLQSNLQQVGEIIRNIVRDNYEAIHPLLLREMVPLAASLKTSISNYIQEVLNYQVPSLEALNNQSPSPNIRSYCVCISMADLKQLLQMVKGAEKELAERNEDRLAKRVQRIELMTKGADIFGEKKDKATGKVYTADRAYALFIELVLPSHLSLDYFQAYSSAFKGSKIKNLLRQVLLSLNDLEAYPDFHSAANIQELLRSLQVGGDSESLYAVDAVPLRLKLECLRGVSRGGGLKFVVGQALEESERRVAGFRATCSSAKDCFLRAITSINFQMCRLASREELLRDQSKKRRLEEFFARHEIRLCLTSPKTRQQELVLRTTLMKDLSSEYRQKLWLQNQSKCVHAALNLQFIKSLTGEPQRGKPKYESHFNSIAKFAEVLCGLPEVRAGEEVGVKEVFFEFIQYVRDLIRSKESEFGVLLENLEWLEENIELKLSKRLYDRLYPRHPLYDDIALHLRLTTLRWLTEEHLHIAPALRSQEVWDVAAGRLRLTDRLRTAGEKLRCIEETSRIIFNSYRLVYEEKVVTADDIYPLVILVLIRAAPRRLVSTINFIESFASQSKLLSKEGYCFTQLKAAIQFCDRLSSDEVTLLPDKVANHLEFSRIIYEKEIEHGIHFMLGKARETPEGDRAKKERLQEYFRQQRELTSS